MSTPLAKPRPLEAGLIDPTGIALALGGAFLFSLKPILIKLLFAYGIDSETQLAVRMGLSLPCYLAFAAYSLADRRRRGIATDLSPGLVAATLGIGMIGYYVASYLDFLGLTLITAEFERLILFTYPTFVALLGAWLLRERLSAGHLASLALTYAGLAIVFLKDLHSFGSQVTLGALLVLGSSLSYSVYLVWSRRPIAAMGGAIFTCLSMLASTVLFAVQFALTRPLGALVMPWQAFAMLVAMALLATVIPSLMLAQAIARIGPGPASAAGSAGPVMTTALAVWILGEPFTLWHLAGMALVIAGMLALTRGKA